MPETTSATVTSGLFPVAQLPAAQVVSLRIYLTNLESEPGSAHVTVSQLFLGEKREILSEGTEVPGDGQRALELGSDLIEGETVEVTVSLPTDGFVPGQTGIVPGAAVISFFTGDQTTSLLQWISAGDFVPVPAP